MILQEQQRRLINRRNFQVGDIFPLKDEFHHRYHWPVACIKETLDKNVNVGNVRLKVGTKTNTTNMVLN